MRTFHHGYRFVVVPRQNGKLLAAEPSGLGHVFQIASSLFYGGNIAVLLRQNSQILNVHHGASAARNDIGNNLQLGKFARHRFYILAANLQRTGTVVIGIDEKHGIRLHMCGMLGGSQRLPGGIAARTGNRSTAPPRQFAGAFNHLVVLFPEQSRTLARRSNRQDALNIVGNLEFNQALQTSIIDAAILAHRGNQRRITTFEHINHLVDEEPPCGTGRI